MKLTTEPVAIMTVINPGSAGSLTVSPYAGINKSAGTNVRAFWLDYYGWTQKTDVAR